VSDISMERLRVISMYDTTEPEYWEHTSEAIRKAVREKVMMARELIRLRAWIARFTPVSAGERGYEPKLDDEITRCRALIDAVKEATK